MATMIAYTMNNLLNDEEEESSDSTSMADLAELDNLIEDENEMDVWNENEEKIPVI